MNDTLCVCVPHRFSDMKKPSKAINDRRGVTVKPVRQSASAVFDDDPGTSLVVAAYIQQPWYPGRTERSQRLDFAVETPPTLGVLQALQNCALVIWPSHDVGVRLSPLRQATLASPLPELFRHFASMLSHRWCSTHRRLCRGPGNGPELLYGLAPTGTTLSWVSLQSRGCASSWSWPCSAPAHGAARWAAIGLPASS
jgi:hypothetical protein